MENKIVNKYYTSWYCKFLPFILKQVVYIAPNQLASWSIAPLHEIWNLIMFVLLELLLSCLVFIHLGWPLNKRASDKNYYPENWLATDQYFFCNPIKFYQLFEILTILQDPEYKLHYLQLFFENCFFFVKWT